MGQIQDHECPICNGHVQVELTVKHSKDNNEIVVTPRLTLGDSFILTLERAWLGYCRWIAEGKPPYKTQYYYDPYSDHVEYDAENKVYKFNIQTYDSPDGDTWNHGTFTIDPPNRVRIITTGQSRC